MIALLFSLALARAEGDFQMVFNWPASGTLNLKIQPNGGEWFRFGPSSLRDAAGEKAELDGEGYHAIVRSYGPFLSLIYGKPGGEGFLVLLEKKNATVAPISDPIRGLLSEMPDQLAYIIKRFAEIKKSDASDVSAVFRSMTAYFDENPKKQLSDYVFEAERGTDPVTVVQKPATRVADEPLGSRPAPRQPQPVAQPRPRVVQQRAPPWYQQQPPPRQAQRRTEPQAQPRQPGFWNLFDDLF